MKKLRGFTLLFVVLVFTLFLFPTKIFSQQASTGAGFGISPPSFDLNANQGDVIKNSIKVNNSSDKALTIKVRSENFVAYGEGGQIALTEEESTYSISDWITFEKTEFRLGPQQTEVFDFTLKIPLNAEPGSHYGAVVFSTGGSTNDLQGGGAALMQEIGSIVLIRLPGEVVEEGKLVSFTPSEQTFKDPKVKLNALVENTGSVHFKPTGVINIYDVLGNVVHTVEVKGRNILPGSKRLFDEEFDFQQIGYFRAELLLIYKNGEKQIVGTTNFWSLYQERLVPGVAAAGGALVFYIIFRKRINKAIKVIIKG